MEAIEFNTIIKNGMIHVPDRLNYPTDTSVKVIIVRERKADKPSEGLKKTDGPSRIKFGVLKGRVVISDDFNDPMPDNILSDNFSIPWCGGTSAALASS